MKRLLICFLLSLISLSTVAQDSLTIVAVGDAEAENDKLAVSKFSRPNGITPRESNALVELEKLFINDFSFYKNLFDVEKMPITVPGTNPLETWIGNGLRFVIQTNSVKNGEVLSLDIKLHDLKEKKEVYKSVFTVNLNNVRSFGHQVTNDIYKAITGKDSMFKTKIVFVSDRTSRKTDTRKELYIMDFDGERKQRLTYLNSMIISPSISPDNTKILYTAIEGKWRKSSLGKVHKVKNLNLYLLDLTTNKQTLISEVNGINSGAVFTEDGKSIYLTLSKEKNADIYKMDLATKALTKVTSHFLDDVDPNINKDGTLMTFLSGRSGKAMIYTMDPRAVEKDVKRISYVGRFNAAPRFSPDGKEIVFSSWVDNRFDLYKIGSDGNNLVRLTKNFGSNEEGWFSPDGEFIVFTSQRVISRKEAVQDIYIMNREGEIIQKITENFGKIYTPRWSN